MGSALEAGNLVRWLNDAREIGVVREADGGTVAVQFDSGSRHSFPAGTDALERVRFDPGTYVEVRATSARGMVVSSTEVAGRLSYAVSLPDGTQPNVLESGLRKAVLTDPIARLRAGELDSTRSTNLRVAATRLAYAQQFDELASLSNSRVEIKPHQVGVVHRVMSEFPHRFLLADEVGLGKTIEAGLIIKELKARGLAKRVLILAPAGLVRQWQFEMKTKFNETFSIYNSDTLRVIAMEHPGQNPWTMRDNIITSTAYAAWSEERRREIALAGWDVVVIDEAHHARRQWQGDGRYETTQLYRLAKSLNDPDVGGAASCLLLTATPMQLHPFELYSLVELLDPVLFPSYPAFEEHRQQLAGLNRLVEAVRSWETLDDDAQRLTAEAIIELSGETAAVLRQRLASPSGRGEVAEELLKRHLLSEVLIRNRKSLVGQFQPRVAHQWPVELTDTERAAYDAVTAYVRSGYDRARAAQNPAIGFLMTTFQKLLCSSSKAISETMIGRISRLERGLAVTPPAASEDELAEQLGEGLEEEEVTEALGRLTAATLEEDAVVEECRELERLVNMLDEIEIDSKARVLVDRLGDILSQEPDAKVIIFTQFRNTQEYLRELLAATPWTAHLFHGSLNPHEKDAVVERFRAAEGPQLLITTEAGGEGRNFQFCHMLVNYDMPWNPMKVEQRIGRIDRIGQKHPVLIFNLYMVGTIEERVLRVLDRRIGLFTETVGGLDPILGNVERDLKEVFRLAGDEAERRLRDMERMLEDKVHQARQAEQRRADFIMDTRSYRRDEVDRLLQRHAQLTNDDVRRFVIGSLDELGCRVADDPEAKGVYRVHLSSKFRDWLPRYSEEDGSGRRVAFDPAVALEHEEVEFFAFGHPVVDALVERAQDRSYGGRTSHRRVLASSRPPTEGWLFLFTIQLDGLLATREVYPVFVHPDGELDSETAEWLLDRAALGKREDYGPEALPPRDQTFDDGARAAEQAALERLVLRQIELEGANEERLERERGKLASYFAYKDSAAREKLERTRATFERLALSTDPDVQKIVPVWARNLEDARRHVEQLAEERERRLGALVGREHIAAQHELLSASWVEIMPDPADALRAGGVEDRAIIRRVQERAARTSTVGIAKRIDHAEKHLAKLEQLATEGRWKGDIANARRCASLLAEWKERAGELDAGSRFLLRGAIDYFLLLDDEHHDLRDQDGFSDDVQVAEAISAAIGSRQSVTTDSHPDVG